MNKIFTITIAVILIAGFFSASVTALSRDDIMSGLTSQSTQHSIFDRLENYHAPDTPICPDGSCSDTSPGQEDTGSVSPSSSVSERIESRLASLSANSNPSLDNFIAERTRIRTPSSPSLTNPDSINPDDVISRDEAEKIALSQIEACYPCPVQLVVSRATLGPTAPAYTTSNPCWYITIDGYFTDPANCDCCCELLDEDGNIVTYLSIPVGGGVVIDAVTGVVQMVSVYL